MQPPSSAEALAKTADDAVPSAAVCEQLARIVNSSAFLSSVRLCRFLTHIVNRTIDGDLDSLKEFSIAMEVFDRSSDYDPNIDAIVRVEARRLRAKLKTYYEEEPGRSDPVLIGLRPGSYVPIFRRLDTPERRGRQALAAKTSPAGASIAVLPFVNMSPEPSQDYFCDGISEEIINALTHVAGLKVIARTSAFQFKGVSLDVREVGRRLDADLVIEGSVRKAGEHLRISVQAIETESGHHVWSETFRRELNDVFAIQEEIAKSVVGLLGPLLPEARIRIRAPVRNFEAYTRYLRARFLIHQQSPEALRAAVEQLRALTEAFPDYALGYSGIAVANGLLALFGVVSGQDAYPEIKANAERGYALDADAAETCSVLGNLRAWFEYRWDEADVLHARALQLQPGDAAAHTFRAMTSLCRGNIEAAESGLRRAAELDPLSASDCARMAYLHYIKGDDRAAANSLAQAFALDHDYPEARFYEGLLACHQGQFGRAIECLSSSPFPLDMGLLAAAYARDGASARAQNCIKNLRRLASKQYVTPLAEAFAAIGMEQFDLAFQSLDRAADHKTNFLNMLAVDPFFQPLRTDARFGRLLKRLNLSPRS